ncbi:hypothetical protein ACJRO7_003407 [Eucalyptus globulus]|uniref:Uncharacterized protein n=1 Tax=Eucalyptus globulus TaxID=34317 RepID=A0ABD3IW56_EUCGL
MSLPDPQTQNRKRSRETSEVFDPVFDFLMNFADTAETIVPLGQMFGQLPVEAKEDLLKDLVGEIVVNVLNKLPDDGKEAFLERCFEGLLPKLPHESRREIKAKVQDVFSQALEASDTPGSPRLPSTIPNRFPTERRRPVPFSVRYPPAVGGRGRGGTGGGGAGGTGGGQGGRGQGRGQHTSTDDLEDS